MVVALGMCGSPLRQKPCFVELRCLREIDCCCTWVRGGSAGCVSRVCDNRLTEAVVATSLRAIHLAGGRQIASRWQNRPSVVLLI